MFECIPHLKYSLIFRYSLIFLLLLTIPPIVRAQPVPKDVKDSIINEGKALCLLREASKVAIKKVAEHHQLQGLAGYVTYKKSNTVFTVFYTNKDSILIKYTVISNSLKGQLQPSKPDLNEVSRVPSDYERWLINARKTVYQDLANDTSFYSYYANIGFEPVMLAQKPGLLKVYIFATTKNDKYLIFGDDYLLWLDKDAKIIKRQKLHHEMVSVPVSPDATKGKAMASMHEHSDKDSPLFTPTDICTILLNKDRVSWRQHIVLSKKYMSIFYLDEEGMGIFPAGSFGK